MRECPPEFTLIKRKTGELGKAELAEIEAHLASCEKCAAAVREIDEAYAYCAERREVNLTHIQNRLERGNGILAAAQNRPRPTLHLRFAFAAAAAIVVFLGIWSFYPREQSPATPSVQFKGSVSFIVRATRGAHSFEVEPGGTLRAGDTLTFTAITDEPGFIGFFTVDSSGLVKKIYPTERDTSKGQPWRVSAAGRHDLPGEVDWHGAQGIRYLALAYAKTPFTTMEAGKTLRDALRTDDAKEFIEGRKKIDNFAFEFLELNDDDSNAQGQ